nr:hypothetical protein [Gammaproteobacteria bacterium]
MDNKQIQTYSLGFIGITLFTFALTQLPESIHIFQSDRAVMFALLLTIIMVMLNEVKQARISSDSIFLRTIPGLKAVEEAVGRSTEMGRPILYVPGIMDMNEV